MLKISPSCHWGNHGNVLKSNRGWIKKLPEMEYKPWTPTGKKWNFTWTYGIQSWWLMGELYPMMEPMMEIAINILVWRWQQVWPSRVGSKKGSGCEWMLCEIASLAVRSMKNNHAIYICHGIWIGNTCTSNTFDSLGTWGVPMILNQKETIHDYNAVHVIQLVLWHFWCNSSLGRLLQFLFAHRWIWLESWKDGSSNWVNWPLSTGT